MKWRSQISDTIPIPYIPHMLESLLQGMENNLYNPAGVQTSSVTPHNLGYSRLIQKSTIHSSRTTHYYYSQHISSLSPIANVPQLYTTSLMHNYHIRMNKKLLGREFSKEEIILVLKEIEGNKAPSLDGFIMAFFQKRWRVVEGDILAFFSDFHRHSIFKKSLNASFPALIPKKHNAENMKDFPAYQPIRQFGEAVGQSFG